MHIACSTGFALNEPLRNLLPFIREAGYTAAEVSRARIERDLANSRDVRGAILALWQENGLALSGADFGDLATGDETELDRKTLVARFELAQGLGLSAITFRAGPRKLQSLDSLGRCLDTMLKASEAMNLDLHLANGYATRIEQLEDWLWLDARLNDRRLLAAVDTGQFHNGAVNPRDAIRTLSHRLGQIRIGDRIGRRAVPLGQGETNVPAIVEDLRQLGFGGRLTVVPAVEYRPALKRLLGEEYAYLLAVIEGGTPS